MKRSLEFLVFAICFVTFAYFYQGGFSNNNSRLNYPIALIFRGEIFVDAFADNTIDKVAMNDHYYLDKAPGLSYLILPLVAVAKIFDPLVQWLGSDETANFLQYLATLWTVAFPSALAALAFSRIILILAPTWRPSLAAILSLITFLATLCLPYSTIMFSHQLATSLLVLGLYFGLKAKPGKSFGLVIAYLFLGFAVFVEYPVAILSIGIFGLLLRWHKDYLWQIKQLWVVLIPLAALLLHNYLLFSNPLMIAYEKYAGTQFGAMDSGLYGIHLPSYKVMIELLLVPYRGLFVYSPVLLLGLLGYGLAGKRGQWELWPLSLSMLCFFCLISGYTFWQGGTCFGPRHLVPLVPFLMLGVIYLPSSWLWRWWSFILVFISLGINLLGTSTTLFVHELARRPLTREYMTLIRRGYFAMNPMGFLTHADTRDFRWSSLHLFESQAFNLGTLMGLRGASSLIPLLLFWLIAFWLLRHIHLKIQISK